MRKIIEIATCFTILLLFSSIAYAAQSITVKGFANIVEKPDIAHIIIKTSGEGVDYSESIKNAESNIELIRKIASEILGESITPIVIKTENKKKSAYDADNYEQYTQDYVEKLAQAMKGEEPETKDSIKKEKYATTIYIYFATKNYSIEKLSKFRNKLATKKLAFNDRITFDFLSSVDLNKSYILYGLSDPYKYLEKLAKLAYENAKLKGEFLAKAVNSTLANLISIEKTCSNEIEGVIDTSDLNKFLGKRVGPVSSNPNMLPLEFNSKFIFEIK